MFAPSGTSKKRLLLGIALLLLAGMYPAGARERKGLQKSATDAQNRAADTYVDIANPSTNFGSVDPIAISFKNGGERGLFLFDFSALPSIGVKQALLKLNVISVNKTQDYDADLITSYWTETDATWNNRAPGTAWGAAGGDYSGTPTVTITLTAGTPAVYSWDITKDAQSWYSGTPNYGTLIKESLGTGNDPVGIQVNTKEDPTASNRPLLLVTFLQNVTNLAGTAGNATVTLTWTNPTPLTGSTVLEAYAGVLILRRQDQPVDPTSVPLDGTTYSTASCTTLGTAQIVFVNTSSATTFTDNSSDTCGAPANGHTWFYKVFTQDTSKNYSTNAAAGYVSPANSGLAAPEVAATPDAILPQQPLWVYSTGATNLAAPGLNPGAQVETGSGLNLLFSVNPNTGAPLYTPVALGGAVVSRATVLDSTSGSISQNVAYVTAQDNFVYAVNADTGVVLWQTNPSGFTTGSTFQGGAAVQLKSASGVLFTPTTDLLVAGTRNTGTPSGNKIIGMNANTGATIWTYTGVAGPTTALDVVVSTPLVDYNNNAIWVTSHSNGGTLQPSLWKLNSSTGAVLFSANLGDIDSGPSETQSSDVLFVGNNAGVLYAINPLTGATLASFNGGDGAVRGYPAIATNSSPYTVIFSGSTKVQAVNFNTSNSTFTSLWSTAVSGPSAPLAFPTLPNVYVGGSDGKVHELNLFTGVDQKQRVLDPLAGVTVGDIGIDVTLSRVFASATDGHGYAFGYPF